MRRFLGLIFAMLLVAPAQAATVEGSEGFLSIDDVSGEVNTLRVENIAGGIRVTDSSAILQPSGSCTAAGARVVDCTGAFDLIAVDLGPMNDQIAFVGTFGELELVGAAGNDRMDLSDADRTSPDTRFALAGNEGDDAMTGSHGADVFYAGPGADVMAGGPGTDDVSYSGYRADIVVNLTRKGRQGAKGEGDSLSSVENVEAGEGDDVLIGNGRDNQLEGDKGRDRLRGGRGDDRLGGDRLTIDNDPSDLLDGGDDVRGERGDDRLEVGARSVADGGPGQDIVWSHKARATGGPGADTVLADSGVSRCGAGRDRVTFGAKITFVARDCERIEPFHDDTLVLRRLRSRGQRLLLPMSCASLPSCDGHITVIQGRAQLAARPYQLPLNRRRTVRLRTRRKVGPGPVRVRITFDPSLEVAPVVYDVRL